MDAVDPVGHVGIAGQPAKGLQHLGDEAHLRVGAGGTVADEPVAAGQRRIERAAIDQPLPDGTALRLLVSVARLPEQGALDEMVLLSIETEGPPP